MTRALITLLSLFSIAGTMSLISCDDDETTPPVVVNEGIRILDLEIGPQGFHGDDLWIMVTDQAGNLLATKQWQNEPVLSINADVAPNDVVDVLILLTGKGTPDYRWHDLYVYNNIKPGRAWQRGKTEEDVSAQGTVAVTIKNAPPNFSHTKIFGAHGSRSNIAGIVFGQDAISHNLSVYDSPDKILLSYTPGDSDPLYFSSDTLKINQEYSLDFNQAFSPFDNILTVPSLESTHKNNFTYCTIGGLKNNEWYRQTYYYSRTFNQPFKTGYNNGFDQYYTVYDIKYPNRIFKTGFISESVNPEHFNLPDKDFTITNNNIFNFDFTVDATDPLKLHIDRWEKRQMIGTTTHALAIINYGDITSKGLALKKFPVELTKKYGIDLSDDGLFHKASTFIFGTGSYEEEIEKLMGDPAPPRYENYWQVTKW